MKQARVSQENNISTRGLGRSGLESGKAIWKPSESTVTAPGKIDPPPTVHLVSERFPALEEQEKTFTFLAPEAREVSVIGNFNGWRPDATPLKNMGGGKWGCPLDAPVRAV